MRVPDLNPRDFLAWRPEATLARVESDLAAVCRSGGQPRAWLVGSSFGGYLAAMAAERQPQRVAGMILLAPAFRFADLLRLALGPDAMERWRTAGSTPFCHYGEQREIQVGYRFYEEVARWPGEPGPAGSPALVVHGMRDEAVPIAYSRAWAATRPQARLIETPDDHSLAASLDEILGIAASFIEEGTPAAPGVTPGPGTPS